MKLVTSLLLGSTAGFALVAGAQAADLPSKKAAPASYVKICDAYGAGFFYVPGTDTCLKVGGYVRAEYQYTPGHNVYSGTTGAVTQTSGAENTTGMEVRGRADLEARTQTAWGVARTLVRVRLTNNDGLRKDSISNNGTYTPTVAGTQSSTLEAAMVQWAGFTFGVAPENYAMMPSIFYHGNAWAGFPNGMKQLAYTATFGGGLSATLAIEDQGDFGYSQVYAHRLDTGSALVGNVKWDQSWGFAAVHALAANDSVRSDFGTNAAFGSQLGIAYSTANPAYLATVGGSTYGAWAAGATVQVNLPMLGAGDKLWVTANYADGYLGALLSAGGLNNLSNSTGGRILGGVQRSDLNLVVTGGAGNAGSPYTIGRTTGFNVAAALVHYWTGELRSQAKVGFAQIDPPTSTLTQWGRGRVWDVTHALIFSPAKDLDIGLELQYLNMKNQIQNPTAAFVAAGSPGLNESGVSAKLRVERTF